MMTMKRTIKYILCSLLSLFLLASSTSCGSSTQSSSADKKAADKAPALSIVCTAFPQYDWVNALLGNQKQNIKVSLLNRQGSDMHSFQPTAKDMIQIAGCDLFLYIGGFSESWAASALNATGNDSAIVLPLLEAVDKKEEVFTEGMDLGPGSHHSHESHESHEDHGEEEIEYDEHIWLSLRCAQDACQAICEALCRLDPAHQQIYRQNLSSYQKQLQLLDEQYEAATGSAARHDILVADRFPFRYLADDYQLNYYAAFPGCSAETEASFDTVIFLAEKADSLKLPTILTTEGGDMDFAQTVVENTKTKSAAILTLDSMQSVSEKDIQQGASYLSIMEENLQILKRALN